MNAAEIARKAAEIVSERGHCKGALTNKEGNVCFEGALRVAANEPLNISMDYMDSSSFANMWHKVAEMAMDILKDRDLDYGPITFNDLEETSGEDIILLLKECGQRLEEE